MLQQKPARKTGLARIFAATRYSLDGIGYALRHESAFRQELLLLAVLIPLAVMLARTPVELALLLGSAILVLIVELLNTAIEALVDLVTGEFRELAKAAKDAGSAAVFISLLLCVLVWLLVIYQRFVHAGSVS
jgi:diacylglycerol kinase (ATP)